jgi:hypothetical protein
MNTVRVPITNKQILLHENGENVLITVNLENIGRADKAFILTSEVLFINTYLNKVTPLTNETKDE